MQELNEKQLSQKKENNKELLHLYRKLIQIQQSCWGKFFRFQHTDCFKMFSKKFTIPMILNFRLDDLIYLLMLAAVIITFCILPSKNDSELTAAFRQFTIVLYLGSFFWLLIPHWYKHIVLILFYLVFPTLMVLSYFNIIIIDTPLSTRIQSYLGFFSFYYVYILLILVYPLKQFIRQQIGSLYSYFYALSFLTLFGVWPVYSLLQEYVANGVITYNFIVNNKALLIAFLVIVVLAFYLLVHHTFFQGSLDKVINLLKRDFSISQLRELQTLETQNSCFEENFNIYSRIMSLIVVTSTLAAQIYVFIYLTNNVDSIWQCLGVMIFLIAFLVYGSILNRLALSKQLIVVIFTTISLVPMSLSPFYYFLNFYQYVIIGAALPYSTIFWCIIRLVPTRKPILRMNVIVIAYLFLHIPGIIFILNSFQFFTSDLTVAKDIDFGLAGVMGATCLLGLIIILARLCFSVKQLPNSEVEKAKKTLDYNYSQEGNPTYTPYIKKSVLSLSWLASLDFKVIGYIFGSIFFLLCQLLTMYIFNQLNNTFINETFYSPIIREVIYTQFSVVLIYYLISHYYIASEPNIGVEIVFGLLLLALGLFGIIFSYVANILPIMFRLIGSSCIVIIIIMYGFKVIRDKNTQLSNFICPILVISVWLVLIIPFVQVFPIISIYIDSNLFGYFVYISILVSTVILIFVVGVISLIFNILMNKFDQDRKIKFIIEDVETYLSDEGVQITDQILYILYESYDNRDKAYVYFLKRGFPVNIFYNPQNDCHELVTYDQYLLNKRPSKSNIQQEILNQDGCWACLNFCFGKDQDQIEDQILNAVQQNIILDQQLKELLPSQLATDLLIDSRLNFTQKNFTKKINTDLSKIYSSKTSILKNVHKTVKHLGDDYVILKKNRDYNLSIQKWHQIFDFISNDDYPPKKIIFADIWCFSQMIGLNIRQQQFKQLYYRFATDSWKDILALNLQDFSIFMQYFGQKYYPTSKNSDKLMQFLIQNVYSNLSKYQQFQNMIHKNHNKKKNQSDYIFSPFHISRQNYQDNDKQFKNNLGKQQQKILKQHLKKLVQPNNQIILQDKSQNQIINQQKSISCKKRIYQKYLQIKKCCSKQSLQKQVIKRKKVKPWVFLAEETVRIMEQKEIKWGQEHQKKSYNFRISFNNIIMAVFKLLDLYTYLSMTLFDPEIGWIPGKQFSVLYFQYNYQLYAALGIIAICVPMGIKGIMLILEDRLGLTQTRVPASFPHPMFLFTLIYKILILSLFTTIASTLLVTFDCTWTTGPPFVHYNLDTLICFEFEHNIYIVVSLIGLIAYYPLSAYTFPNFQFADKTLDLKYRPSYLVLYFQVNFVLVVGQILLTTTTDNFVIEMLFICINIFSLILLAFSVIWLRPCLIQWFNFIEFLVIIIGVIFNIVGLIFYLTKDKVLAIILASCLSLVAIIVTLIYIKLKFFSSNKVFAQTQEEVEQMEVVWNYSNLKNINLLKFIAPSEKYQEQNVFSGSG